MSVGWRRWGAEWIRVLQDAGGQIGWLQVACCTRARMRLYTQTLENLSRVQRLLMRELT